MTTFLFLTALWGLILTITFIVRARRRWRDEAPRDMGTGEERF